MKSLVLVFSAYVQSWGETVIGHTRRTANQPTKSAITGIIASSLGRDKGDDISDISALKFAVRADRRGVVCTDYHTVRLITVPSSGEYVNRETLREYIYDGIFVAAISGDDDFVDDIAASMRKPSRPIFLGRRSCIPDRPVFEAVVEGDFQEAIESYPPQASYETAMVTRDIKIDDERDRFLVSNDLALSFDSLKRSYASRATISYPISGGARAEEFETPCVESAPSSFGAAFDYAAGRATT